MYYYLQLGKLIAYLLLSIFLSITHPTMAANDPKILNFQDFTSNSSIDQPASSSSGGHTGIEIPSESPASKTKNSNPLGLASTIYNNLSLGRNFQNTGLSQETIQQLTWLSNERQRIAAASNQQRNNKQSGGNNWGLGYLAQYFDITTDDVIQRILWSAIPFRKAAYNLNDSNDMKASLTNNMVTQDDDPYSLTTVIPPSQSISDGNQLGNINNQQNTNNKKYYSYMERFIHSRPDMYGPLWISITLVFSIAIFSNIVSFINYKSKLTSMMELTLQAHTSATNVSNNNPVRRVTDTLQDEPDWHYSMEELNMAASAITFYSTLMPIFTWSMFWCQGYPSFYTLTETICAFGYSLSIFIPLSVLFMIQIIIFRYIMLILASFMSGVALFLSFLPIVQSNTTGKGGSHLILLTIPFGQFCLGYILHRIMLQPVV